MTTSTTAHTHAWGTQPEMFGPRHEHRLAMIVREVRQLPQASRVLDAAIGLGQLAGKLYGAGYRVVGIDYSFEAALHVRRTSPIPVIVGDLTMLPFRTGAFDGVTTGETLEHLDDDRGAAREIGRVVRRGGRGGGAVPALQRLLSKAGEHLEHRPRHPR